MGNEGEYFKESAKMLALLIHLMRGTPYIYQGEEIGMTNPHYKDISQYKDVESLNYYSILLEKGLNAKEALKILAERSRDNSRSPMQWSAESYAGFSDTQPWLELSDNFDRINVENQINDKNSVLNFYKELIKLRKTNELISRGGIAFLETGFDDKLIAYKRYIGDRIVFVYCNLTSDKAVLKTSCSDFKMLIGNYKDLRYSDSFLELRPYEAVALET